mgnify:CR=1 FL=1
MKYMKKLSLISLIFYFSTCSFSYAIDLTIYEGDEYWEKRNSLNWIDGPATVKHLDQGFIQINENQSALTGEDARQMMYWINGVQYNIDVFVQDLEFGGYTDYTFDKSGYVKLDDWKDIDPDKFLKELKSGTEEGNKLREEKGFNTITNIVWLREPTLNKEKNTVSYATNVSFSDGHDSINAALLILGRYGYAESTVVATYENFELYGDMMLNSVISNYSFVQEKKYSNFTTGDKVAAAGIAGLLAGSLGIKAFKAGGFAALLILMKKFWFVLLFPIIFVWGFIKRLFLRNN